MPWVTLVAGPSGAEDYGEVVYTDVAPCSVCGSKVRLRPHSPAPVEVGPVGPTDGVVGSGDPTVDDRVCTNDDCPTNATGSAESSTP
jgi:hypothetical protein